MFWRKSIFLSAYESLEILYLVSCLLHINGFVFTEFNDYETWFVTLMQEHKMKIFVNKGQANYL